MEKQENLYFFNGELMDSKKFIDLINDLEEWSNTDKRFAYDHMADEIIHIKYLLEKNNITEEVLEKISQKIDFTINLALGRDGYFQNKNGFFFPLRIKNINLQLRDNWIENQKIVYFKPKLSIEEIGEIGVLYDLSESNSCEPSFATILSQIALIPKEYLKMIKAIDYGRPTISFSGKHWGKSQIKFATFNLYKNKKR